MQEDFRHGGPTGLDEVESERGRRGSGGVVREKGAAEIQTIGAGALNQAVKAIAIARGFMAPSGVDLICRPAFADIIVDGQERTAIRLMIEPK